MISNKKLLNQQRKRRLRGNSGTGAEPVQDVDRST